MRDVILTLILVGMLPVSLRRPFLGALMFAVIGLANPHRFTWGFAYSMPWAQAYAGVTILGMLFTSERMLGDSLKRYFPVLLYLAWMGVTTIFAMEQADAAHRWVEVAKVHLMCLVTLSLLTDWGRVKQLIWVVVCSIGFFGLKGGVFTITSGGDYLVWGPPQSAIQDNNHLAVGLVVTLPMMYWLFTQAQRKWLRALIAFSGLMTVVSIFGSHSRSAFLGIAAMSVFLLLKSQHKFSVGAVGVILAAALASFMPAEYWDRMETIRTYQQDASAMGRINTWHTAIRVANDRILGAGFEYYGPRAFSKYAPNPEDIHSAHSIYFQALGEHGWIGLAMFLVIWLYIWSRCRRIVRLSAGADDGPAMSLLAKMIQVSLVGFAVGGAFVNIGNWDMMYYLAISALATARVLERVKLAQAAMGGRNTASSRRPRSFGNATPATRT